MAARSYLRRLLRVGAEVLPISTAGSTPRQVRRTRVDLWPGASVVAGRPGPIVTKLDDQTALVRRRAPKRRRGDSWLVDSGVASRVADAKALVDLVASRDVLEVLDLYRVNCVVDVGANVGQYAQRLRAMGWRGRIVSFEPLPTAFAAILTASASDPDWRVMNVALGRADGEATMNVVAGKGMTSSLLAASDYGRRWSRRLAATTPLTVQVRRLDALLPEILQGIEDPRVYLKLDTQGYDLEAFAGVGRGLDLVVAMQSEVSSLAIYEGMPDLAEAVDTYRRHGFDLAGCWPVTYEPSTHRALEFDAVLVRRPAEAVSIEGAA